MPSKKRNSVGIGDRIKITLLTLAEDTVYLPKHMTATVELKEVWEHPNGSLELVVERVRGVSGVIV